MWNAYKNYNDQVKKNLMELQKVQKTADPAVLHKRRYMF